MYVCMYLCVCACVRVCVCRAAVALTGASVTVAQRKAGADAQAAITFAERTLIAVSEQKIAVDLMTHRNAIELRVAFQGADLCLTQQDLKFLLGLNGSGSSVSCVRRFHFTVYRHVRVCSVCGCL